MTKQLSLKIDEFNISKPPPKISAKCWCIFDVNTSKMLEGSFEEFPREIASLTKIMTCLLTIQYFESK